jgi:hypothetical protein
MTRGPCTFRQKDVTRATKAVLAAGLEVARVEVAQNGSIAVVLSGPQKCVTDDEAPEDLRKLL